MSKIKFDAKLNSKTDSLHVFGVGIKSENKIMYKENDVKVTLYLYKNKVEMERVTDEYKVKLSFKLIDKELSTYKLKGYDEISLDVDTETLFISENCIRINYSLENEEFSYILNMEDL